MNNMVFTNVIPRLRALETRLLDKTKLDRMIDSPTPWETIKVLQETEYAVHMSQVAKAEDYENVLAGELRRVYKLLYEITPVKSVVELMSIRYDYHNLKVLLKAKALKIECSQLLIPVGVVETGKLKNAVMNDSCRDLPLVMRQAILQTWQDFERKKDPQKIDIIMDQFMYRQIISIVEEVDNRFIEKFIKSQIDLINIKSLLRAKRQNKGREFLDDVILDGGFIDRDRLQSLLLDPVESIPGRLSYTDYAAVLRDGIEAYIRNGSMNSIEKLADNYIMKLIKDAKYISFGPEPLIAYLYAKENEIKLIRIIMVGKINKLSPEEIRERLRDNYV